MMQDISTQIWSCIPIKGGDDASCLRMPEKKLPPWIAKLTEKSRRIGGAVTELRKTVPSNKPIQIKGYSRWTDSLLIT